MKGFSVNITAKLWMWEGKGAWHFITVDENSSEVIKDQYIWPRKGFGSIPVKVTIGKTTWKTSIFPEKKGTFLLPIKKSVREAENLVEGKETKVTVEVLN